MTRRFTTVLVVAFLTVLASSCATTGTTTGSTGSASLDRIQERGELVVGTTGNMPPMNMTDRTGKIIGLDVDLANVMAGAMGVELRLEPMVFAELLPALEAGNVDVVISNMTITPERNLRVAFVGPYFDSGKCVLSKIETLAKAEEVDTINQGGVRLTALRGSTSEVFVEELAPKARFTPAQDYDEAVSLVLNDKVDAMIADYPICVVSLLRHKNAGLVSVVTTLIYEPIGIALPPGDTQFINWTENFLERMEETNQLEVLRRRWFERGDWFKRLP
ncbi:MAG: transporter substrate-binding domain-containing protein [Gammaproteobacteria bacterium]|nr:transporter substrate-binding domain-containing protein [Gammaproteobacteria bacterium]